MRKLGISLLVVLMAVIFVSGNPGTGLCAEEEPLLIYCGAGLMKPMDELYPMFQEKHDCQVRMIYAGSGELFGMIATRQNGDVYIPGAEKYTKDALEKGMVVEKGTATICYHVPVILTPKGNPGNITCLEDLAKEGLRLALADSKAAAIGKTGDQMLAKNGLKEAVEKNVVARPSTTNQLLIYAATGQVDATIAWEDQSTWAQSKGKVEIIHIETAKNIIKTIPASVVSYSKRPEMAQEFIEFITSEEGRQVWKKWGFPLEKPL
ncbi:MAG TPA: molybdate ABC transporter substrate-binding protein [Synergistales bacterium]|nr:molybdate ABC transporter substrate-binding protein [Synergistales bacterium]